MDKSQFDVSLGGTISISHDVEINKLISARASEIAAMTYSVENPRRTKLIFQKLPVHMRRRVMSHNAKRMPRRLREAHLMQMQKSGLPPKAKRPSRKYRRRPQNLLLEYNRRKRNKKWLETHIWHAKRFHMCEKWGYKIADFSNDRGFRACYRAVSKHCMIQDISYYSCIQLNGPEVHLLEKLRIHSRDQLSFGARMYLNGSREGNLMFYKKDNSPIGVVNFLWRPSGEENKSLWIWVHPAFFNDIVDELSTTFGFDRALEGGKLLIGGISRCKMELLRDSFNRFRIRGPLSIAVLSDTLKLPKSPKNHASRNEKTWNEGWYENLTRRNFFTSQKDFFEKVKTLNSPGQLPRGSVLALTVLDPRIYLPEKREKAVLGQEELREVYKVPDYVADSPLWEEDVRERIKLDFQSTNEIDKLRNENLVPGVQNDGDIEENFVGKVPVILVQYPGASCGNKSTGFSSGIDIILPSKWALPFWISFMYRCARPIGLRENQSVIFENLMLNSPEVHHPDTSAYIKESLELKDQLIETYFRRPPNRRINFTKFSISSPFYCEWSILIKEWTNENTLKVLRNSVILQALDSSLNNLSVNERQRRRKSSVSSPQLNIFDESIDQSSLVCVRVQILGRGRPKKFAIICTPAEQDLKSSNGPVQCLKPDPNQNKRRQMTKEHKIFLKRAMRRRSKARKEKKVIENVFSRDHIEKHKEMMKSLYLPECKTVRHSCDREVMGYIIQGDFCFTESTGIGWGYIVLESLLNLIKRKSNIVLVRNVQSRQYRRAKLDIIR